MKTVFSAVLLVMLAISGFALAAQLQIVEPVSATLSLGDTLDLGTVGPGQKVVVVAKRPSGELSRQAAGKHEALWDRLLVDGLPPGFSKEDSKLYEDPFQAFVTVAKDAADGDYFFTLRTLDEYDGIAPITLSAKLRVSRDVLGFAIKNKQASSGVDQPAVFFMTLSNIGSASDVFEISASGLPSGWMAKKRLFVSHNSEVNIAYEVVPKENGNYPVTFRVQSLSSESVFKQDSAGLKTETSVWNDVRTSSNGVLLFPSVQQTLYALWSFFSHLFN